MSSITRISLKIKTLESERRTIGTKVKDGLLSAGASVGAGKSAENWSPVRKIPSNFIPSENYTELSSPLAKKFHSGQGCCIGIKSSFWYSKKINRSLI